MPLKALIEVPGAQSDPRTLTVKLRIENPTGDTVAILNPDMGIPSRAMEWPYSNEVYRTSVLISFHFLSISVTDEDGSELPRNDISAWSTPVLQPPVELPPGEAFEFAIPIGSFYKLESGMTYQVALAYGDRNLRVSASAAFRLK